MEINTKEKLITSNTSTDEKNIKFEEIYSINVNTKIQHTIANQTLLSNKICTSKYNYITAVPTILCEQFSKVGNIYFLFLAILQMIPVISQSEGLPTNLIPLIFVILVNGIKDFCEDYKRKQSDGRENKTKCVLIDPTCDEPKVVNWEDLRPGNIVKIYKDEYFPSDIVMIFSTNKNGVAYVETKNLDGETNLKYKESLKITNSILKLIGDRENTIKKIFGKISCDVPNPNMYEFRGNYFYENRNEISVYENEKIEKEEKFEINCRVSADDFDRDHDKCIDRASSGFQIHSRSQKKRFESASANNSSMYNKRDRHSQSEINSSLYDKRSSMLEDENLKTCEKETNAIVLDYNNLLLRGSSLRNTEFIYGIVVYAGHNSKIMLNSINAKSKQSKVFLIMNSQLMLIILLQIIICLSFGFLYSLDPDPYKGILYENSEKDLIMKFFFILENFIYSFLAWMLTTCNIVPISLLVTIEMIKFCQAILISWDAKLYDRQNKRSAIVQSSALNEELGQVHNIFTDKTGTLTKNVMQFKYMVVGKFLYGSDNHIDANLLKLKSLSNVDFNDPTLFEHWNNLNHINSENIQKFVFSLALCHSIIVENKNDKIEYNASSPDELALVNAAKYFGVEFTERTDDNFIVIKFRDEEFRFKLLHIFEFNSDRKRMSVVIKDEKGVIRLISKGADSVILSRLDTSNLINSNVEKAVVHYLESFGTKGLRTLIIAEREISVADYKKFKNNYYNALSSTTTAANKKELIEACYEILEKDLILLGATAIEDCLQDDLKPTLEAFREIGIKVWMLTGDHPFTAVSIAHSCGLIEKSFSVKIISKVNEEIDKKILEEIIDSKFKEKVCLVITGDVLTILQKSRDNLDLFLKAINKAVCVIGSRVSPKQKADLVLMVKRLNPNKTTLAIGDGANDVNMISSADVGIGIMGNEGQQAARASDYVIGQFSFLKRLMFVHGREAYRKNSFAVGYILWKNFLYVTPCIFLGVSSYFSGQSVYDPILDTLYNIIFTAYPIGWFATFDRELNHEKLESTPHLYKIGMNNKYFNVYVFWRWYVYAFTMGLIIFWINTRVFEFSMDPVHNTMVDFWSIGSSMYTCIVFVVNLKLLLATNTHNFFTMSLIVFSVGTYFGILFLTNTIRYMQTAGQWEMLIPSRVFQSAMILIITACVLCEYGWMSIQFIIEEFIIKYKKTSQKIPQISSSESSFIKKFELDDPEKEFSVRIDDSINRNVKHKDSEDFNLEENKDVDANIDDDQNIISNRNRRYTGFAFVEDVANVNIINARIKEDFFYSK